MQQKGMLRLMGLNYTIVYKQGRENIVADALSRKEVEEGMVLSASAVKLEWAVEVTESYKSDPHSEALIDKLSLNQGCCKPYTLGQEVLRYKEKICVGEAGELRPKLVRQFHDSLVGGHSGVQHTYQ